MTLALVHGFTGSTASWDAVAAALGIPPPLCLALLGHGAADTEHVQTFDAEVARLAAQLPPEPVHLAGYSLGARLALGLAVAFPERIEQLTLVSGQAGLASEFERTERRRADARWCGLLEQLGIAAFVDAWEAQPLFATQSRLPHGLRAARRRERLSHEPHGLVRSLRVTGLAEMPHYARRLGSLPMPVTVLAGELDPKFVALGRDLAAAVRRGRFVVAPEAGHDLLLEAPDLVARELRRAF